MKIFAFFDMKISKYICPFFSESPADAERVATNLVRSREAANFYNFPSDFSLYCLGDYDDVTGLLTGNQVPLFVVSCGSLCRLKPSVLVDDSLRCGVEKDG